MVPPVKVTLDKPTVAAPPQVVLALPDTRTPPGNVSIRGAVSAAAALLLLFKVMVRAETRLALILAGLKALPSVGAFAGCGIVRVATAGAALLPLLVSSEPADSELM